MFSHSSGFQAVGFLQPKLKGNLSCTCACTHTSDCMWTQYSTANIGNWAGSLFIELFEVCWQCFKPKGFYFKYSWLHFKVGSWLFPYLSPHPISSRSTKSLYVTVSLLRVQKSWNWVSLSLICLAWVTGKSLNQ